jgi:hypothetical protein
VGESKKEPEVEEGKKKEEDLAEAPLKPPGEEDELDDNVQVHICQNFGFFVSEG